MRIIINKKLINELSLIIWLCLIQVMILNQINFLGYINPYFYVVYVLGFSADKNKYLFLFLAFFLGWTIDHFMNTFGIHAFCATLVAYIRIALNSSIRGTKDLIKDNFSIYDLSFLKKIMYVFLFVTFHHLSLTLLEEVKIFNFNFFLLKGLYSSIFTSLLCLIYFYLNKES